MAKWLKNDCKKHIDIFIMNLNCDLNDVLFCTFLSLKARLYKGEAIPNWISYYKRYENGIVSGYGFYWYLLYIDVNVNS